MMEGSPGADSYGATKGAPERSENSKLMATAVAGALMESAKNESQRMKNMVLNMREGPVSIKALSYVAGAMLVVTGFFSFFGSFFTLHPIDAVVQLYMFTFGWIILFLEAKSVVLPKKIVAGIHKYCAFTAVVWGRGYFFIFVGTLALAQWKLVHIVMGVYLVLTGAGMVYWGHEAYRSLESLQGQMKNPAVVEGMFKKFDNNHDGTLNTTEMGNLLQSLGAHMRPTEIEAAIIIMDKDSDGKIDLREFQAWWAQSDAPEIV